MRLIEWTTAPEGVRAAFSTREGGVSEGDFASLNLGLLTEDDPANVIENRRRLCAAIGMDADFASMAYQVHGAKVVEAEPLGVATPGMRYPACDGLATGQKSLALMLVTADCVPVVLARPGRLVVLHVGWRGLLSGVVEEGVRAVGGDAAAAIGPGIGPCCYEVGEEVSTPFRTRLGAGLVVEGRLDLAEAIERSLVGARVVEIERVGHCTACEPELFFSHRRDRGRTGRQGVVAALA